METYNGHVRTPTDAIILFEACRLGLLPRVQRRLSEKERQSIRSGSVFVWDEREAGMRRWTDGKSWSASRVSGSFLTYREMEGKRGGNHFVTPAASRGAKTPDSGRNSAEEPADGEEGPDGYRYKPDGLMKQSFSITTNSGQHLHLISYYSRSHPTAPNLRQPSTDPTLSSIQIPKGMYPESSVNDQSNTPAVTRSPMPGAPNYVMAQSPTYNRPPPPPPYPHYPGYVYHPNGYMYPISPIHTPPGHYAAHPGYGHAHPVPHGLPPLGHPPSPYGPPPPPPLNHAPPSQYDQRPLRGSMSNNGNPMIPATLQHSASAPAVPQLAQPSSPRHQAAPSQYPPMSTAGHQPVNMPQIDPRLTQAVTQASENNGETGLRHMEAGETSRPADAATAVLPPPPPPATSASQIPAIGSLVNGTQITQVSTNPGQTVANSKEQQKPAGNTSPGRGQDGVRPQDIPSEKLGFREDMRVLSKLDRVFARV